VSVSALVLEKEIDLVPLDDQLPASGRAGKLRLDGRRVRGVERIKVVPEGAMAAWVSPEARPALAKLVLPIRR